MKLKRKYPCGVCGKNVIIDTVAKTVFCGCGTYGPIRVPSREVLDSEFDALP